MPPQGTNLVLSSDIPHGERDVLVLNGLDVESCEEVSMFAAPAMTSQHIPIVGMVVTISPNFNLYRMVVLPAASRPT